MIPVQCSAYYLWNSRWQMGCKAKSRVYLSLCKNGIIVGIVLENCLWTKDVCNRNSSSIEYPCLPEESRRWNKNVIIQEQRKIEDSILHFQGIGGLLCTQERIAHLQSRYKDYNVWRCFRKKYSKEARSFADDSWKHVKVVLHQNNCHAMSIMQGAGCWRKCLASTLPYELSWLFTKRKHKKWRC